jgi:hypothetical protein
VNVFNRIELMTGRLNSLRIDESMRGCSSDVVLRRTQDEDLIPPGAGLFFEYPRPPIAARALRQLGGFLQSRYEFPDSSLPDDRIRTLSSLAAPSAAGSVKSQNIYFAS